ncbi:hypothetical protein OAU86_01865 [Balneolaceae bacterium]|jgi:hypothetical protein|nr:hypothetical protein [Balneolaceae bacterium]MDC3296706.1 hypothetical protein [Balneolaceae bacterium]
MRKYLSLVILLLIISNNLLAQGIDENNPTATENYLIQVNDNISERGQIYKITPDSILIKFEFLGDVSISRESNLIVEVEGGSLFSGEILEISDDSLLFNVIGLANIWVKNRNIVKLTIIEWQEKYIIEPNALVDFRLGLLSAIAINFEKELNRFGDTALLSNFGLNFLYTFNTYGPGIHITGTMLSGLEPIEMRDSHFEINAGLVFGLNFTTTKNVYFDPIYVLPRISLGYRYQNPSSNSIFRFYVGFFTIGFSIGSK